jgi:DNA-3-methyladenine glycosylase
MNRLYPDRFPPDWFQRPTLCVARQLIGCVLVHQTNEGTTAGRIVETEAYLGPHDRAAHSYGSKLTPRNRAMFGPKGHAYIYFIYGMHWCFNIVTGPPQLPQAVLIRALEPLVGLELMRSRLGQPHAPPHTLCRGPGKLCRAMGITAELYGMDLCGDTLYVVPASQTRRRIAISPRVGIAYAGEYAAKPWRFFDAGNPCVSRAPRIADGPAGKRRSTAKG